MCPKFAEEEVPKAPRADLPKIDLESARQQLQIYTTQGGRAIAGMDQVALNRVVKEATSVLAKTNTTLPQFYEGAIQAAAKQTGLEFKDILARTAPMLIEAAKAAGYADSLLDNMVANWNRTFQLQLITASQMAIEQARQFQMASTAQQLEALDSFVDKLEKRRQDEEAKKESERAAPAEERKAKKKASLKKSESKETEEKEATPTKLYNEVRAATLLKDALLEDKGLEISDVIKDSKFQTIFEDQREEALRGALKNLVPSKLSQAADALKAGAGGTKADIGKYDSVVQTALVSAYRKSLEQYYEQTPKA